MDTMHIVFFFITVCNVCVKYSMCQVPLGGCEHLPVDNISAVITYRGNMKIFKPGGVSSIVVVWCLSEIPTATGEAACANRTLCGDGEYCPGGFVCINKTCYRSNPCEGNWTYSQGSCYFYSTDLRDWNEANETCSQYATPGLVEVESADEDNFLKKHHPTGSHFTMFWIGGRYYQPLGYFAWSNGNRITEVTWSPTEPDDGPKGCLGYVSSDIGLIDVVCREKFRYICEKSVETEDACGCLPIYTPVCGSDGKNYPNKCEADRANVTSEDGTCAI